MEPTRSEILSLKHTDVNYLQPWLDWYQDQDKAGPGLVINNIRAGITAPSTKPKRSAISTRQDRRRYLQWKGIQSNPHYETTQACHCGRVVYKSHFCDKCHLCPTCCDCDPPAPISADASNIDIQPWDGVMVPRTTTAPSQ